MFESAVLAVLGAVGGVAPDAQAATQPNPEPPASEVILVTTRLRSEAALEAPVSVTAFGAADIARLDLRSIDDMARFTPGLSFAAAFGRTAERPVMRGQSNVLAGQQFGVEPGVAYFVDGAYFSGSISALDPGDIERVEIARGPQSSLYGRSAYAGAVNIITRSPTASPQAEARIRLGSYGDRETGALISGPLAPDRLGFSLSVRESSYDGEWTNTVTGQTVGAQRSLSVSGVLEARFGARWTSRLRLMRYEDRDGPLPAFLQPSEANNCQPGFRSNLSWPRSGSSNANQYFCGEIRPAPVALNTGPTQALRAVQGVPVTGATVFGDAYNSADATAFDGLDRDGLTASLTVRGPVSGSGHMLVLTAAARTEAEAQGYDADLSAVNFFFAPPQSGAEAFFANTVRRDISEASVELRLSSPEDLRTRWILGVFAWETADFATDIAFTIPNTGEARLYDARSTNRAVFALLETALTDRLTLTAEARWAEDERRREEYAWTGAVALSQSAVFRTLSPRVTAAYDLRGGSAYLVYAQGVKPGGLNGGLGWLVDRSSYAPEEADSVELGYKAALLDGAASLTAAAFAIRARDVQVSQAVADPTGRFSAPVAVNQAAAETIGLELAWTHTPTPAFRYGLPSGVDLSKLAYARGAYAGLIGAGA